MNPKQRASFSALVVAGLLTLAPTGAFAGSYDANKQLCLSGGTTVGYSLNAVESAILAGVFNRTADRDNLLVKLANANVKTTQGKTADAVDKLTDISDTASALAGAAKPKLVSADAINAAVLSAVNCLTKPY